MPHLNDLKLHSTNEFNTIAIEMVRMIETTTLPILAIDSSGFINHSNANVVELTRLPLRKLWVNHL
jgi:hypothetical protein